MSKINRNFFIVAVIALVYIMLFIPVNLQCSEDPNMLVCGSPDEYMQYPYLMSMTMPDRTLIGTIRKAIDHRHYYYGYPFYFVSAVAIAPIRVPRVLSELQGENYTRAYMLVLRELSPIFMAAALILLVAMWTRFENLAAALSLFVFLAAIPSVFWNNMWWHPDSMATFFVVATLFCLNRDNLNFGKWFYLSAITCGIAASTKVIGLFFVVCIPTYLVVGLRNKRVTAPKAVIKGAVFVGIMVLTVLATYPLLLVPHKAVEIFNVLKWQSDFNDFGEGVKMDKGLLAHYSVLRDKLGLWPLYILSLVMGVVGLLSDKRRSTLNIITLTWSVPFFAYLIFVVARNLDYYYIPVLLPFFALIWNLFYLRLASRARQIFFASAMLFIAVQFSLFIEHDVQIYLKKASEEKNSPAIHFYEDLRSNNILGRDASGSGRIYRDPHIYLPPVYDQKMDWSANYADLREFAPEFVLLERKRIDIFSDPRRVEYGFEKGLALRMFEFYGDAKRNEIQGYSEIFRSDFAVAFKKRDEELAPRVSMGMKSDN